jgi:8-hydroxy-5-deazaflavin:NADPH oxidoreductase
MSYKVLVSMNIAIIGVGEIAENYAAGFAFAGHKVFAAPGETTHEMGRAVRSLDNVHVCNIEDAAHLADLVIIATAPKDVREVAYWLGDVRRKVIIDASANIRAPDDELVRTLGGIQAITGSAHVVKVFDTQGYEQMLKPLFKQGIPDLLLAGDSKKAKAVAEILGIELGMKTFCDFGGNDTIPLFNEMTKGWRNLKSTYATEKNHRAVRQ